MKAPTTDQLLRCIEAWNKAAEIDQKQPVELRKLNAPTMDKLHTLAVNAMGALEHALLPVVKIKPISK